MPAAHLVFRVAALPVATRIGDTTAKVVVMEMRPPESAPILRANFETRKTVTGTTVQQVCGVRLVKSGLDAGALYLPLSLPH